MRMLVPMTECREAKQSKAADRKQENPQILVLPAAQQNGQAGGRQDGQQHPLVKSQIYEKTASNEGKGNQ